jgi:hypothetical protein
VGYAVAVPAVNAAGVGALPPERAGIASGVLNSSRQVGAAIGLAALGSIGAAIVADRWRAKVETFPASDRDVARGLAKTVAGGDGTAVGDRIGLQFVAAAHDAFTSGTRSAMIIAGLLVLLGGSSPCSEPSPRARRRRLPVTT